jgi:hypothetical protein
MIIGAACASKADAGTLAGMLTSLEAVTAPIDLTAEGQTDWAYWGLSAVTDFDQKLGGSGSITNYTLLGSRDVLFYDNSPTAFSWSDGTPDTSANGTTTGIYFPGGGDGYEVDVAADTTPRLLNIYVGAWAGTVHFEASLSDGSAAPYADNTLSHSNLGGPNRRYSIIYAANSSGQTLKIKAWVTAATDINGNVTLQAATLQPLPPLTVSTPAVSPAPSVGAGTIVALSAEAQGAFPYSYNWLVSTGGGFVSVPNSNTNALRVDTTGLHGVYTYEVVVTNNSGGAVTSAPVSLTVTIPNGVLQVRSDDLTQPAEINLTTGGTLDWAHWGLNTSADFDQKAGVVSQIANYVAVGTSLDYAQYSDNLQGFTWTDGSPDLTASDSTTGIYVIGIGNGFEVDVQAQQTNLLFNLYVGVYTADGSLATLHLEASLSDGSAPTFIDETLSGSANRRYSFMFASGTPNQTLKVRYWTLGASDGNVTLQSATLQPVPPLSLAQPVVWPTNTLAAGSTFKLSVAPQGPFPYYYQWQVNSGSGYGNVANSNTNLIYATPPSPGAYAYRVVITNNFGGAVTSAPVTLTVTAPTSTLAVSFRDVQTAETIDLTVEGKIDWASWGLNLVTDFDQKSGVASLISNYTPVGSAANVGQYGNNGQGFTWSDGTPTPTATNSTTGIYNPGIGNGFQLEVPAATTNRVLKIYMGAWQASVHFEAALSDGSAPFYFDESLLAPFAANRVYTVSYAAPASGASAPVLTISYWMLAGNGNVTLSAATLSAPLLISLQPAGPGQWQLTWPYGLLLESTNALGPWSTNGSPSPYTITPTGPQKYFRVVAP